MHGVFLHGTLLLPYYRPQWSWGKVIFSVACVKNSVRGRGGSTWAGTPGYVHPSGQVHPLDRCTPWTGTPHPGQVHPLGRYTLLGRYTPRQVHLQAGTPPGRYTPQAGTPPLGRYTPQARYTPGQVHPSGQVHPPEQVNDRTVRIPLECILVFNLYLY